MDAPALFLRQPVSGGDPKRRRLRIQPDAAEDEVATVQALKINRQMIGDHVARHHGRVVDSPGDNLLAEFPGAVHAVQCAIEIQDEITIRNAELPAARRIEFRIGVHLGEVMSDEGRIYGDGVNIAARLEALAPPGDICISSAVRDQTRGRLDVALDDRGQQKVKNIAEPICAPNCLQP